MVDVVAVALAVRSAVKLGAQGLSQLMTRITDDIAPLIAPYRNIPKVYFPDKGGFDITPGRTISPGTPPSPPTGSLVVKMQEPTLGGSTKPVAQVYITQGQQISVEQTAMSRQVANSMRTQTPATVSAGADWTVQQAPGRVYGEGGSYSDYVDLSPGSKLLKKLVPKPAPATGSVAVIVAVNEAQASVQPLAIIDGVTVLATLTKDDNCTECASRNPDTELCSALSRLKSKGGTKGSSGVQKLCGADMVKLPNPALKALCDKLLSADFTPAQVAEFLADITLTGKPDYYLTNHVEDLTVSLLGTWTQLNPSNYEERFDYLEAVNKVVTTHGYRITRHVQNEVVITNDNDVLTTTFKGSEILAEGGTGSTTVKKWRNQLLNLVPLIKEVTYKVDLVNVYVTDSQGRVNEIRGRLIYDLGDFGRRDSYEQTTRATDPSLKNGIATDQGGHMIAARFDGPVEQINYFPMNETVNRSGAWKLMENQWGRVINGTQVPLDGSANRPESPIVFVIRPVFIGNSGRPVRFNVEYRYNGVLQTLSNNPNYTNPILNP